MLLCGKLGDEGSVCFRADQRRNWKESDLRWNSALQVQVQVAFPGLVFCIYVHTSERTVYLQTAL